MWMQVLQRELDSCLQERADIASALEADEAKIAEKDEALAAAQAEIQRLEAECSHLHSKVLSQRTKAGHDTRQIHGLEAKVAKLEKSKTNAEVSSQARHIVL